MMTEQNRRREMINKAGVQRKRCKNEEEKLRNQDKEEKVSTVNEGQEKVENDKEKLKIR